MLATLFVGLAGRDLLRTRGELVAARTRVQGVLDNPSALRTADGRAAALARIDKSLGGIDRSRQVVLASRPLSVVTSIPFLRSQREGLLELIDDSRTAVGAGRTLVAGVDGLADHSRIQDGAVPVAGLAGLEGALRTAGRSVGSIDEGPAPWGPVGTARRQFDALADRGARRLLDGADAIGAARTFLGAEGNRRYLVALQNNAEMRNEGAVLSFVVVRFAGGRLGFERRGSTAELALGAPTATPIPPGTQEVFGPILPTQLWQSVNATADFALSGRAMVDMYAAATGESLDGVIALDVPALAGVLQMIGPVAIEGVAERLSADNAGRLLLHDLYEGLLPNDDQSARRERLGEVLQALIDRLVTGTRDGVSFGIALGDSARGGHLRLWSRAAGEEQVFERTGLGGGPATGQADRTFHLAVENRTATKLDYFVRPAVRQRIELDPDGSARVRTTVVIDNRAPAGAAPSYVLGPDRFMDRPGQYLAWLLLWAPAGSFAQGASVDESGLSLSQRITQVDPGSSREVTFETVVPDAVRDGRVEVRLVPQARLVPMDLEVTLDPNGWQVRGPTTWRGQWDRVVTLSWRASR